MPDTIPSIVSKVWGMCNPQRDDGVFSYYLQVIGFNRELRRHSLDYLRC